MDTRDTSWMASGLIALDIPAITCSEFCFDVWPDILEALVEWVVYAN